nr:hypothetical protein [Candidatus Sigynarchaeota archaeon]
MQASARAECEDPPGWPATSEIVNAFPCVPMDSSVHAARRDLARSSQTFFS